MLIEIEGIDGVGKTTQCRLIKNWFENSGEQASIVKDLESTTLGRQMKAILTSDMRRSREVELFGFLSCKAHLFTEAVSASVAMGEHVIFDRGMGSFLSYFEVLGFEHEFLLHALSVAVPVQHPLVTLLIDADVGEALRRNVAKPTHSKFDNMGKDFFERQRAVYLRLAQARSWRIIDGRGSIEEVHEQICGIVNKKSMKNV